MTEKTDRFIQNCIMISCGTMNLGSLKPSIDRSPFLLFLYHRYTQSKNGSPQWDQVLQRKNQI